MVLCAGGRNALSAPSKNVSSHQDWQINARECFREKPRGKAIVVGNFGVLRIAQMQMMLPVTFPVTLGCLGKEEPDRPAGAHVIMSSAGRQLVVRGFMPKS